MIHARQVPRWLFGGAAIGLLLTLPADPLTGQQVDQRLDIAFGLVPLEHDCTKALDCAIEVVERGDSSVLVSHPGDRYRIVFENRGDKPAYAGLLVVSGAMDLAGVAGPHPLWPGEPRVLSDTVAIDNRLGTDLLILLVAPRYFSGSDFSAIYAKDFVGENGWRVDDLVALVRRNEAGIRVAGVYYHQTTRREQ